MVPEALRTSACTLLLVELGHELNFLVWRESRGFRKHVEVEFHLLKSDPRRLLLLLARLAQLADLTIVSLGHAGNRLLVLQVVVTVAS
jgi:hypothetical protein